MEQNYLNTNTGGIYSFFFPSAAAWNKVLFKVTVWLKHWPKAKKQRGSKEFIKNSIVSTAIWKILLSLCEQHSQMQHFVSLAQNLWMNSSIESKL